ncbi:MAG: GTPase [Planctomycetaceae bacterium]
MWNPLDYILGPKPEQFAARKAALLRAAPIPCLWLFGKTGSGKTSLIRQLTAAEDAQIGAGFRPTTRESRLYDFPESDVPLMRFLDTRGLGESGYDPGEDIATFREQAHLLIVTVRATDQATEAISTPLREIRRADPDRPVLLVLTALHDAYPGQPHPATDPFDESPRPVSDGLPGELSRCLEAHYARFDGLFDRAVPVDFTKPDHGYDPPDLGAARLRQAILDLLPSAYRQTLLRMTEYQDELRELYREQTDPVILAHAALAGSSAAEPVPWIDIPLVLGIQSNLLHRLAKLHGQSLDSATLLNAAGIMGGRIALRMGVRELLKFIPWVGMAANAAAAFAWTFGSGRAANWYFLQIKHGATPTAEELQTVYREQLALGAKLWKSTPDGISE